MAIHHPEGKDTDGVGDLVSRLEGEIDRLDSERRRDRESFRDLAARLNLSDLVDEASCLLEQDQGPGLDVEAHLLRLLADLVDKKSAGLLSEDSDETDVEQQEEERSEELFRHLMEFSRYREVARELDKRAQEMRDSHSRIPPEIVEWERVLADIEGADLGELVGALERLLAREAREEPATIPRERVTVAECVRRIKGILKVSRGRVNFGDLFPRGGGRSLFVGTFIALLELIRGGEVTVSQRDRFGDIQVFSNDDGEGG